MIINLGSQTIRMADAARILNGLYTGPEKSFKNICTDSREADKDSLFVAIRGENVDGHNYIRNVIEAGCKCVLCEKLIPGCEDHSLVVPDSVEALSRLAHAHKNMCGFRTIGITGSVGKTTTKEFVYATLKNSFRTEKTEENHNSVIGMPLDLLRMSPETEVAVLEMGMSARGEISRLSACAEPEIAMITNIGSSHVGMLGSRENIFQAKMEIVQGMLPGGHLVLNGDEPLFYDLKKSEYKPVYVGMDNKNSDIFAENIRYELGHTTIDLNWMGTKVSDIRIPIMGAPGVYAAMYAFAAGYYMGLDSETICAGVRQYASVGMRQHIEEEKGVTLIEDCYNASPESMRAAMDILNIVRGNHYKRRRIAVLGDMLELGRRSPEFHYDVGRYAAGCSDMLLTFGKEAEYIAEGARSAGMAKEHVRVNNDQNDIEKTGRELISLLNPGDVVLFKASRGIREERVISYVKENYAV